MLRLLMRDEAQHIERLIARAGMDAARAGAILTGLELGGWARQLRGQRWIGAGARAEGGQPRGSRWWGWSRRRRGRRSSKIWTRKSAARRRCGTVAVRRNPSSAS